MSGHTTLTGDAIGALSNLPLLRRLNVCSCVHLLDSSVVDLVLTLNVLFLNVL